MKRLLKNCDILSGSGLTLIKNGFLGVEGDTICCLAAERPKDAYDEERDMGGALLLPGLVNCHTHAAMTLLRGVGSDLPLQQWLFDKVFPIEDRLTKEDIRAGSFLAILEMLSTGTTSFSDMYFDPRVTIEAVGEAGMKANISRPVQSFDPDARPEDSAYIRESLALFDEYNGAFGGRVLVDFCVHAEYTCTERIVKAYADLCRGKGGRMHIHLSETKAEHEACKAKYGKTPARWFYDLGALGRKRLCRPLRVSGGIRRRTLFGKGRQRGEQPHQQHEAGQRLCAHPSVVKQGNQRGAGHGRSRQQQQPESDGRAAFGLCDLQWLHRRPDRDAAGGNLSHGHHKRREGSGPEGHRGVGGGGKRRTSPRFPWTCPHMMPAFEPLPILAYSAQGQVT